MGAWRSISLPTPELGLHDTEAVDLLKNRTLDMAEVYPAYVSGDLAVIEALNLWGLYPDLEIQIAAVDKSRDAVVPSLSAPQRRCDYRTLHGQQLYLLLPPPAVVGRLQWFANTQLPSSTGRDAGRHWRRPLFVEYFDVYGALEDGPVEAAISCGTCGFNQRWYEVADYLYGPIKGSSSVSWVVMNGDFWDEIPPEFQAIIIAEGNRHWEHVGFGCRKMGARRQHRKHHRRHESFCTAPRSSRRDIRGQLVSVLPRWVERAGGPHSEAVRIFNEIIGPIIDVQIYADGSVAYPVPPKPKAGIPGLVAIEITDTAIGPEAMAVTPCDGPTAPVFPVAHGGGSPAGESCGNLEAINFNLTPLVSSGHDIKIPIACVDFLSVDCELAGGAYRHIWDIGFTERVKRRTNGQVQFVVTSFSELGVSGANSLRLIEMARCQRRKSILLLSAATTPSWRSVACGLASQSGY